MKILFMGTTDFAVSCLDAMRKGGYSPLAVVTKADKPKNRGMKLQFSAVKEYALAADIPVFQPETLRSPEVQEQLRSYGADLFVVVAYGKLLPKAVLELPRLGCINVHGSLLPKYRGAAPIQWSVLNGDGEAGVSTMYLAEGMDSGDVIHQMGIPVAVGESFGSVYQRLKLLGGELLVKTLGSIADGTVCATPQNAAEASYAPPITKADTLVDWSWPPEKIASRICGLDPRPGARAMLGGQEFKVFAPELTGGRSELADGEIVTSGKNGLEVACGGGRTIRIGELQAPGGKRMRAADYLRGHRLP